jgi:hypothetical protein
LQQHAKNADLIFLDQSAAAKSRLGIPQDNSHRAVGITVYHVTPCDFLGTYHYNISQGRNRHHISI